MRTKAPDSWPLLTCTAALWAVTASAAPPIDITECDQDVPHGRLGILQADLVCDTHYAVHLDTDATLDMQGFSITLVPTPDGPGPEPPQSAVYCATLEEEKHSRCRVISSGGPGVIAGGGLVTFGIFGDRVDVENVAVSGFAIYGIY